MANWSFIRVILLLQFYCAAVSGEWLCLCAIAICVVQLVLKLCASMFKCVFQLAEVMV